MSDERDPQIAHMVPISLLPSFDWADQSDDLGDFIQEAAHAQLGARSFSTSPTDATTKDFLFRIGGVDFSSQLLLRPSEGGLRIGVVGPKGFSRAEVDRWRKVVEAALALLDRPRVAWHWAAIVGPAGTSADPGPSLAASATVGDLTVRPASRAIRRVRREIPWQPYRAISNAWPAIVEGSGWTYDWKNSLRAQQRARRQLHRLCALLTVAFQIPWTLEWDPASTPPGILDTPEALLDPDAPDLPFGRSPAELPPWVEGAWGSVIADQELDRALGLFYEATNLIPAHPSMALIAFVGTVEVLAYGDIERCATCDQVIGSTGRFKTALAEVMTAEEAAVLGRLYQRRSRTAHAGQLFGFETTFNQRDYRRFIPGDGQLEFTMRLISEARRASGLLLVRRFEEAAAKRSGA